VWGQRGFTLIETIVVAAILAVLASVAVISLAQRPGALASAVTGFDASLAAARAIAATSGNGATLVFAARANGSRALPGFTLTVYRGRPTGAGAVTPTTVMAISSEVSIREASLGTPTFAIFLSSAGHASGQSAYPAFGGGNVPTFAPIGSQPPCPSGGFVLSFADAHATQTRALPCRASLASTPSPLSTMAPSAIVLTPKVLTYYWPASAQQHFVATEWGYTRWFAASEWSCGSGVAAFPASDPAPPYSAAFSAADANAIPLAPSTLPYSFANSSESMEDAPAWFYLTPQAGGLCSVTIGDARAQSTSLPVQVMGALTASPTSLTWSDPTQTGAKTVSLGKTYDGEALAGAIGANSCNGIVTLTWGAAGTPSSPSVTPATQTLTVTPVLSKNGFDAGGNCSFMVISQYPGEPGITIAVNVTGQLVTDPVAVQYPLPGGRLPALAYDWKSDINVASTINGLLGGSVAFASEPACTMNQARAYTDAAMTLVDASDTKIGSDPSGCFGGGLYVNVPSGGAQSFSLPNNTCGIAVNVGGWNPGISGTTDPSGTHATLASAGAAVINNCALTIADAGGGTASYGHGLIAAQVLGPCSQIGETCTFTAVPWPNDNPYCTWGEGNLSATGGAGTGVYSFGSAPSLVNMQTTTTDAYGYLTDNGNGSVTFTRTALGADTVSAYADDIVSWQFLSGGRCKGNHVGQLDMSWRV